MLVPRGFCVPSVGGGLDDKFLPVVHPTLCSSQVLVFTYFHEDAVLEEVLYPPPESDQVHCCFLVDLDVPRLPQDLLHGVDDPPLTLELDGLASPRWTVEGALSRQGGSRQESAQGDRGTNKAPDPPSHGALPKQVVYMF